MQGSDLKGRITGLAAALSLAAAGGALVGTAAVEPAAAQIPPAVKFLIGGLNGQLPRKLDDHTVLTHIGTRGDVIEVQLTVEPGSPALLGIDVRREAARLCGIDIFRTLTAAIPAQVRVSYMKPDRTPVGSVVLDRSFCRS